MSGINLMYYIEYISESVYFLYFEFVGRDDLSADERDQQYKIFSEKLDTEPKYMSFHEDFEQDCASTKVDINKLKKEMLDNPGLIMEFDYIEMNISDFEAKLKAVILSDKYILYKKKGLEYSIYINCIESVIKLLEEERKSLFEKYKKYKLENGEEEREYLSLENPEKEDILKKYLFKRQSPSLLGRLKERLGFGGSRQKGIKRSRKFKRKGKTRNKRNRKNRTRRIR